MAKLQAATKVNLYVASLLIVNADPVVIRGRPMFSVLKTETHRGIYRGSMGGMQWKIISPVLEIQFGDDRGSSTSEYKETKSQWAELEVGGVHSTVEPVEKVLEQPFNS